jgi:hypothetical protein
VVRSVFISSWFGSTRSISSGRLEQLLEAAAVDELALHHLLGLAREQLGDLVHPARDGHRVPGAVADRPARAGAARLTGLPLPSPPFEEEADERLDARHRRVGRNRA